MNDTLALLVFLFVVFLLLRWKYHQWLRKHDWWNWYSNIYLKSWHWKHYRIRRLLKAGYVCEHCGRRRKPLQVHHLSYDDLWHEKMGDTMVLCVPCHNRIHQ